VWQQLQGQVILGDAAFAQAAQGRLNALDGLSNASPVTISAEIPRAQRLTLQTSLSLAHFVGLTDRNLAMAQAFASGAHTQQQIAQVFGLHYASVSRIVRKQEGMQREVTAKSGQGKLDC
jgi:putative transposase